VGGSLEADLRVRDFTVNAMAAPVANWPPSPGDVTDPTGGLADLSARVLRATSPQAFDEDPLRLLRGVRLSAELGMVVEPLTRAAIRERADLLRRPAPERVREELLRLVAAGGAGERVVELDELGLLRTVLPELASTRDSVPAAAPARNVFEHSARVADAMEAVLGALGISGTGALRRGTVAEALPLVFLDVLDAREGALRQHMEGTAFGGHARWVYLVWAALLHDVGKVEARAMGSTGTAQGATGTAHAAVRHAEAGSAGMSDERLHGPVRQSGAPAVSHAELSARASLQIAERLRFGRAEEAYVATVVRHHPRPLALARGSGATRRDAYRFFRDAGAEGVDVTLLALADNAAKTTSSPDLLERLAAVADVLLRAWFDERREVVDPVPFVDGDALMAELGLHPGPLVGRVLAALREEQAAGTITDRNSALALAERLVQDSQDDSLAGPV